MEVLLTMGVMAACFLLLGVGVMFARRKVCLRGSCGGASAKDTDSIFSCDSCSGDSKDCVQEPGEPPQG